MSAAGNARAARRRTRPPGPPTWPKNPRQDSFGNPTTKRPGDVETAVGKNGKWRDMRGARKARSSKDWR
jgi:hypothetical protein